MAGHTFDHSTHLQIPDNDLSILASTRDKSIALANVDIRDKVEMPMETRLQGQRVTIPNLQNSKH